jgi:LacI family transcriptional regulator
MRRSHKITMASIAKKCQLSRPSVSYALSGKTGAVSEATRVRVVAAARELGYRPHRAAQALRRGVFHTISLLYGPNSYLPKTLLISLSAEARRRRLAVDLAAFEEHRVDDPDYLPDPGQEQFADGALLLAGPPNLDAVAARLEQLGTPIFHINRRTPENAVFPDDFGAGRQAAIAFLTRGHRRALCVQMEDTHYSAEERRDGFIETFRAGGGVAAALDNSGGDVALWQTLCQQLAVKKTRPTAIFATTDRQFIAALTAMFAMGLRSPNDVSLLLVADRPVTQWGASAAYLATPWATIAAAAISGIAPRVANGGAAVASRRVPYEAIIPGDSLGQAPT